MDIDWKTVPYDHSGRWEKKILSIMNQNSKVTWPQFIAEMVIYWRIQFLKDYKDIKRGPNWHNAITKQVRNLNQQTCVLVNYFPHPDDEPLVTVAFKNYFRKFKPLKIGQYRKIRINKEGFQNITQDEKDIVKGIWTELERLIKQRDIFKSIANDSKPINPQEVTFQTKASKSVHKNSLSSIIALENKINLKH